MSKPRIPGISAKGAVAFFAVLVSAAATPVIATEVFDLVVRGGLVLDGSGTEGRVADVGVRGERIVAIGDLSEASAKLVVDAQGLTVAPGFIDTHSHVPETLPQRRGPLLNEGFLTQGVTTFVGGPDGFLSPEQIRAMVARMETDGITTNFAFYVGHNGIRTEVMGGAQRAPTLAELNRMKALVRTGMQMGTVGLSTGLMYAPGVFSTTAEVIALAREVKPFGGTFDSHTRDPAHDMLGSDREVIEIGKAAGIPAKIAHLKAAGLSNKGHSKDEIALIEQARAAGQDVVADQYPYDGGATANLDSLIVIPGKPAPNDDGWDHATVRRALRDRAQRAQIRRASEQGADGGFSWIKAIGYDNFRIVDAPDAPQWVGQNLQTLARVTHQSPFDLVTQLILDYPHPILITQGTMDEADVRAELKQPWNMICSDGEYVDARTVGRLHPRFTGTFPRVLGHYVRDVKLFSLTEAVRKMTSLPASHLHLRTRGRIAVGYIADITVFDANTVSDRSTWTRPELLSTGIVDVIVNGVLALRDGRPTGATPGHFIRPE
jgi:N-acyl-D-amino-acid deacylase